MLRRVYSFWPAYLFLTEIVPSIENEFESNIVDLLSMVEQMVVLRVVQIQQRYL